MKQEALKKAFKEAAEQWTPENKRNIMWELAKAKEVTITLSLNELRELCSDVEDFNEQHMMSSSVLAKLTPVILDTEEELEGFYYAEYERVAEGK